MRHSMGVWASVGLSLACSAGVAAPVLTSLEVVGSSDTLFESEGFNDSAAGFASANFDAASGEGGTSSGLVRNGVLVAGSDLSLRVSIVGGVRSTSAPRIIIDINGSATVAPPADVGEVFTGETFASASAFDEGLGFFFADETAFVVQTQVFEADGGNATFDFLGDGSGATEGVIAAGTTIRSFYNAFVGANLNDTDGRIRARITILLPAPGAAAVLAVAGGLATRRRRAA